MSKTNARLEFLGQISGKSEVLCCEIQRGDSYDTASNSNYMLTTGYTPEEYLQFLKEIDFYYDNGYGGQELFGTIWYKDGTWSSRGDYDGSEWWQYNICPEIPEILNRIDKVREEKLNKIMP